jgi:phosphohistidine swiveling domain-containing protein
LSAQIARHLEDDDEHLARLYAVFRLALRAIWTARIGVRADWESALDLAPCELFALLEAWDDGAYATALAAGRARAQSWAQEPALTTEAATCVVPGKVRGPACVRRSALEAGPPPLGSILLVPAISPFDAIVFSRIRGLVVEAPERLSHAVILAREHGIPTLIGMAGACERWKEARELELDAALGRLASVAS